MVAQKAKGTSYRRAASAASEWTCPACLKEIKVSSRPKHKQSCRAWQLMQTGEGVAASTPSIGGSSTEYFSNASSIDLATSNDSDMFSKIQLMSKQIAALDQQVKHLAMENKELKKELRASNERDSNDFDDLYHRMLIVESEVFKKEYQLPTRSPRALDAARKLCELGFSNTTSTSSVTNVSSSTVVANKSLMKPTSILKLDIPEKLEALNRKSPRLSTGRSARSPRFAE